MREAIKKTVLAITVLHPADYDIANTSLEQILVDVDMGPIIGGGPHIVSTENVPDDQVEAELLAIGNDGTFFDPIGDDWPTVMRKTGE